MLHPGSRLDARGRGSPSPGLLNWLYQHALFEPAHFNMERKMLLEIKRLAERRAAKPTGLLREGREPAVS